MVCICLSNPGSTRNVLYAALVLAVANYIAAFKGYDHRSPGDSCTVHRIVELSLALYTSSVLHFANGYRVSLCLLELHSYLTRISLIRFPKQVWTLNDVKR